MALYYRLTIPETPRYTFDVARDIEKAAEDTNAYMNGKASGDVDEIKRVTAIAETAEKFEIPKASWADFFHHYGQWKNGKILLGTAGSWFFLDVAYYGLSLNNAIILVAIGYAGGANVYEIYYKLAVGNLILVLAGAVPGYWVSVAFLDIWGRKPIQFMGFIMLTILFIVIGFAYNALPTNALLALYVLSQFFFNFGPNTTTFIVPGECFPTRYRSTSHGISAASGKVGAIIAQAVFGPLKSIGAAPGATGAAATPWINHIMQIFALVMLFGVGTTFFIPETARKTLEELAGEVPGVSLSLQTLPQKHKTISLSSKNSLLTFLLYRLQTTIPSPLATAASNPFRSTGLRRVDPPSWPPKLFQLRLIYDFPRIHTNVTS